MQPSGETLYSFLWATHGVAGGAAWVLMTSTQPVRLGVGMEFFGVEFHGEGVVSVGAPPTPGVAQLAIVSWGSLTFRYLGCGRAEMYWNAVDERISDGGVELQQIAQPQGVTPCRPPAGAVRAVRRGLHQGGMPVIAEGA